jgi:hypothetical protein
MEKKRDRKRDRKRLREGTELEMRKTKTCSDREIDGATQKS